MKSSDNTVAGVQQPFNLRSLEGKEVIKNPVASGIEGEDICATCGDPFDQMWNEETEEWILKNTIKVDGK
ncbi:pre-mRNA cleavage complex 2 protein Pcf11, partial [Elysia marginata]